jgi:tetratricopeptide (TPR) repeat protein
MISGPMPPREALVIMLPFRESKPARGRAASKEDFEFEIQFFEGIARRDPDFIEALQILGDAYTKTGQWKKGLRIDKRLARLCHGNPLVFYNLACSYSLLKKLDEAFAALDEAIKLGYKDARWLIKDPDLNNLRQDNRFKKIRTDLSKKPDVSSGSSE